MIPERGRGVAMGRDSENLLYICLGYFFVFLFCVGVLVIQVLNLFKVAKQPTPPQKKKFDV